MRSFGPFIEITSMGQSVLSNYFLICCLVMGALCHWVCIKNFGISCQRQGPPFNGTTYYDNTF